MASKNHQNEVPEGYLPFGGFRPLVKMKDNYVRIFQEALLEIANDPEYTRSHLRLLLGLLALVDYENLFKCSKSKLGEKIGMPQPSVSRAWKLLEKRGIVQPVEEIGNVTIYRLDPRFAYRSRNTKYSKVVKAWDDFDQKNA